MARIEYALAAYVKTQTTVTDYIGTGANSRIWFIEPTTESPTLPYITYETIAVPNIPALLGVKGASPTVQFDVWHNHKTNGLDLANALRDVLDQYSGTLSSIAIELIQTNGPITLKDPVITNLYHFVVDAIVDYER